MLERIRTRLGKQAPSDGVVGWLTVLLGALELLAGYLLVTMPAPGTLALLTLPVGILGGLFGLTFLGFGGALLLGASGARSKLVWEHGTMALVLLYALETPVPVVALLAIPHGIAAWMAHNAPDGSAAHPKGA